MPDNNKHIELIIKHLANEITDSEKIQLQELNSQNPENLKLFDDYQKVWKYTEEKIPQVVQDIDLEQEWNKLQKLTNSNSYQKKAIVKSIWKYVASVAALVVLFVGLYFIFGTGKTNILESQNQVVEFQLPDNSHITLNSNSKIEYPRDFENNRTVNLKGDAYFVVEHNPQKPFIVKTEKYYVEVIGTEFYVNTTNEFEVIVNQGVVKVYSIENKSDSTILRAGDKIIANNEQIEKTVTDNQNYIAWKTGKIIFTNTKLNEIVNVLQHTYNVEIIISDNKLGELQMTASFDNQTLESVFKVLEETLDLKITKQGQ